MTPLNPNNPSVTVRGTQYQTSSSPSTLPNPAETSLSVITPPAVTSKLLREAKEAGIRAVWLQPGSFDEKGLEYAVREFPGAAVGGDGWCVLVDGEGGMRAAGKKEGRL